MDGGEEDDLGSLYGRSDDLSSLESMAGFGIDKRAAAKVWITKMKCRYEGMARV